MLKCFLITAALTSTLAAQIYDNAMIAAGLLEDGKDMVARMYRIMEDAL